MKPCASRAFLFKVTGARTAAGFTAADAAHERTMGVEGTELSGTLAQGKRAARGKGVERLGRFGLAAVGVSWGIVGGFAIALALGKGGKATGREGALKTLASGTGGKLLVALIAVGFAAYAIWRFAQAFFDRGGEGTDEKGLAKRAVQAGKGALYVGLTGIAVSILLDSDSGSGGGDSNEKQATAGVLGWPGGEWIVLAAGAILLAVGAYQVYRGVSGKFMRDLNVSEMGEHERRWTRRLGTAGLFARGVAFGIIGWFLIDAARDYDARKVVGLGGALAKLAHAPYGPGLLGVTAAGFFAYGLFCLSQARYRQV